MTIIDIVTDILLHKTGTLCNNPNFYEVLPSNYLLQRWISMSNNGNITLLNETINKLYSVYGSDREFLYKMLVILIDSDNIKINYIKKPRETINEEMNKTIKKLAVSYELSEREVKEYMKRLGDKT